ncbi:MAG: hypothetical protein R6U61_07305 [Thermoplasmata archaeon]
MNKSEDIRVDCPICGVSILSVNDSELEKHKKKENDLGGYDGTERKKIISKFFTFSVWMSALIGGWLTMVYVGFVIGLSVVINAGTFGFVFFMAGSIGLFHYDID